MSTHAYASAVVDASVDKVWALLRDFTFSKVFSTVESGTFNWVTTLWCQSLFIFSVALEDGATGTTVGGVRVVTFKGGAQSRQRLTGVSDIKRSVSYEDIENAEVVSAVAASETTITLTRITQTNSTLVAWARDFSSDVTGQNIIDAQDGMVRSSFSDSQ